MHSPSSVNEYTLRALRALEDPKSYIERTILGISFYHEVLELLNMIFSQDYTSPERVKFLVTQIRESFKGTAVESYIDEIELSTQHFPQARNENILSLIQRAKKNLTSLNGMIEDMVENESNHDRYHMEKIFIEVEFALNELFEGLSMIDGKYSNSLLDSSLLSLGVFLVKTGHQCINFSERMLGHCYRDVAEQAQTQQEAFEHVWYMPATSTFTPYREQLLKAVDSGKEIDGLITDFAHKLKT